MRNKYVDIGLIFTTFCLLGVAACKKNQAPGAAEMQHAVKYRCPMHPNYTSDRPGDCPICSMKLVPIEEETPSTSSKEKKVLFYRNPMRPEITSPVPAKDEMGMDYAPVYEEDLDKASSVPGHAAVRMSESQQQKIGVHVSSVEKRQLIHIIRATARVAHDSELYSAIKEAQAVPADDRTTANATRLRLAQMGLSETLIKEVTQPGYDASFLLVAEPDKKIWIDIDVYADEAALVKGGERVRFTAAAAPGKKWEGRVRSIERVINRDTRTLRARAEVMNMGGALRSEMFLNAVIQVDLGKRVAVPLTAVMDTGTRKLIYVQTHPGEFSPREVQMGFDGEGWLEIVSGVNEGDNVVTSANFLVDSESKIKGTIK